MNAVLAYAMYDAKENLLKGSTEAENMLENSDGHEKCTFKEDCFLIFIVYSMEMYSHEPL